MEQAKALQALGHEVRILSNVQLGVTLGMKNYLFLPYSRYEHEMEGITVYQSFQRGLPKVVRPNVNRWVSIVSSMFADYIKKYGKPDILHAHCVKWGGYAAMQLCNKYAIPYVITEHLALNDFVGEFGLPPNHCFQIPLLKESLYNASCVIPVSKEIVSDLSVYFGSDYRWEAIPNLIDTSFFSYRQRKPLSGRSFRFCCLGIFVERKGYDVLFRAFQRVLVQYSDVELHIAGFGTDSAKCRQLFSALNVKNGVTIHGELDKQGVRDLLYQADALVLATRGETQGLVLLEALSTGIPAISTEAIPQSVRPQKGCIFVPVDDVNALADAMLRTISSSPTDGKNLSEVAHQLASPEIIAKQIAKVLADSLLQ